MDAKTNWNEMILNYRSSGLSLSKWCAENGISKAAMRYHLYDKKSKTKQIDNKTDFCSALVPVKLVDFNEKGTDEITIEIKGASIRVDSKTNMSLLKKLIEELR